MTDEVKRQLWDAIAEYVSACGGTTDRPREAMMKAVPKVEQAVRLIELAAHVEAGGHLERGATGKGVPTDVFPDWVYEARDAIRRQNENPPHFLGELCAALGWQGGTYHQALKAVQRLVGAEKDRWPKCATCGKPATCQGTYEGIPGHSCDTCCGHGNEDGACAKLEGRP